MIQEANTPKRPAAPAPAADEDLSDAIALAIEKAAGEEASVVRVFDDRYRCNWWVRDRSAHWLSGTTGTIQRSAFLKATRSAGGLVIEDLNARR